MENAMTQAVEQGLIMSAPFDPPGMWGEIATATPRARQTSRATREFAKLLEISMDSLKQNRRNL
jgi:hypothetical protein